MKKLECKVCNGDIIDMYRIFVFSKSIVICYAICSVCCINSYIVIRDSKVSYYINDKRYGFESNNFKKLTVKYCLDINHKRIEILSRKLNS